jgi:hypothetical protein
MPLCRYSSLRAAAFVVQGLIALALGLILALLPAAWVSWTTAAVFLVFGLKLLVTDEEKQETEISPSKHRIVLTQFLMVTAASGAMPVKLERPPSSRTSMLQQVVIGATSDSGRIGARGQCRSLSERGSPDIGFGGRQASCSACLPSSPYFIDDYRSSCGSLVRSHVFSDHVRSGALVGARCEASDRPRSRGCEGHRCRSYRCPVSEVARGRSARGNAVMKRGAILLGSGQCRHWPIQPHRS